jgi:hypothetical protein
VSRRASYSARRRAEARHEARVAPAETAEATESRGHEVGSVIVLGPGDAFVAGEIDIRRGGASMGVYGNPLEMRMEGDRATVVGGYRDLITGSKTASQIARERRLGPPNVSNERIPMHRRMQALSRLAERVRNGETLRLRCACKPRECHGDVIAEWIHARREEPAEP